MRKSNLTERLESRILDIFEKKLNFFEQAIFSIIFFGIVIQMEGLQLKPRMESCRMWVRTPSVPIFALVV